MSQNVSIKASYYASYSNWQTGAALPAWPIYACIVLLLASFLLTSGSAVTVFLLFFTFAVMLVCALWTKFYANAEVTVSPVGIDIIKGDNTTTCRWPEISSVGFLIPRKGNSSLQIVLAIYTNDGEILYVFIDSLNFNSALSRVNEIGPLFEQYLKDYKFAVHKSDFHPHFMRNKQNRPKILE